MVTTKHRTSYQLIQTRAWIRLSKSLNKCKRWCAMAEWRARVLRAVPCWSHSRAEHVSLGELYPVLGYRVQKTWASESCTLFSVTESRGREPRRAVPCSSHSRAEGASLGELYPVLRYRIQVKRMLAIHQCPELAPSLWLAQCTVSPHEGLRTHLGLTFRLDSSR